MNGNGVSRTILFFLIPLQLIFFTFIVPPFQKPDEQLHFEKALIISQGYFFCTKKSGNVVSLEKKVKDFINNPYLDLLTRQANKKIPKEKFFKDLFAPNSIGQKANFNVDHLCSFPITSYLPQTFALKIASLFNLNPYLSLYLGRLIMAVLGFVWFLYLYKKIDKNYRLVILFSFALPMTLHQISSFSYDAVHVMLAFTFFAMIINTHSKRNVGFPDLAKIFFVLFLLLASKKIGYETFYLFLFLIPYQARPMLILSMILIPLYTLSKLSGSHDLSYLPTTVVNPVRQLNFLLAHPFKIFSVFINTTISRADFYLQSLIGIFGWLEYGLNKVSYFLYGLFFVYLLKKVELPEKKLLTKLKKSLLFFILITSYVFIIFLAYFFNTGVGEAVVHGVQGRYFLPFLPFIIWFILQVKDKRQVQKIIFFLFVVYLIFSTFSSIYSRYY